MNAEQELYHYCGGFETTDKTLGCVERARIILGGDVDVNSLHGNYEETALTKACRVGSPNSLQIIKLLLAHPNIDVNKPDIYGDTAIINATVWNKADSVTLLLMDGRADLKKKTGGGTGRTPFWIACREGRTKIIEAFLMHADVDLTEKCRNYDNPFREYHIITHNTPIEASKDSGHKEVVCLLKEFEADKEMTRRRLKKKNCLGGNYDSASLFILSICYSERYFTVKDGTVHSRFFDILTKLPAELQMMVCNRAYGVFKTNFVSSFLTDLELKVLKLENFFVAKK